MDKQFVIFSLAGEKFAFSIENVVEVIKKSVVVDVPRGLEFLEGIIHFRGKIVPVVDLAKRFKLSNSSEGSQNNEDNKIIIISIKNKYVGFVIDDVDKVISISENLIEKNVTGQSISRKFVEGIAKINSDLIIIINTANLLTSEEQDKMKNV
ncbi:MAG: chemotaxis protein CheW [Deferribacterota bacterium]|nr:chemotaxis protein CheW [Deferribacterota bacterium]